MKIQKAYKTELKPNKQQIAEFCGHAGINRFAFNWALGRWKELEADYYLESKILNIAGEHPKSRSSLYPNILAIKKEFNAWKKENAPFTSEYAYQVVEAAIRDDLGNAFKVYNRIQKEIKKGIYKFSPKQKKKMAEGKLKAWQIGYPRFKKSGKDPLAFQFVKYSVENDRVKLPRIGWVKLKEKGYIPTKGVKYNRCTISEQAGRWFISCQVELELPDQLAEQKPIAIHLGLRNWASASNGIEYKEPKALEKRLKKLAKLNQELARRKEGSENWKKTKAKLAKLHYRIACIREWETHNLTTNLTRKAKPSKITIQDFAVKEMLQDNDYGLERRLSDANLGEIKRQIMYKADWYGSQLELVPGDFPSSKRCSNCGNVKVEFPLSKTVYKCEYCGLILDRDINAVRNLEQYRPDTKPKVTKKTA